MLKPIHAERIYPYAGGIAAGLVVLALSRCGYTLSYSEEMLSALVSLGGIFAGFLATVKTLLLTMDRVVMRRLRESGYISDLLLYLKEGIYSSLILCLVAMIGFNSAISDPENHAALLFSVLFFALLALYRIARISMALLLNPEDPDEEDT